MGSKQTAVGVPGLGSAATFAELAENSHGPLSWASPCCPLLWHTLVLLWSCTTLSHPLIYRKQLSPFYGSGGCNGPEVTEAWEMSIWNWEELRAVLGLSQVTPNVRSDEVAEIVCCILNGQSCSSMLPSALCFSLLPPCCHGCDTKSCSCSSALSLVSPHVSQSKSLIQQKVLYFFG